MARISIIPEGNRYSFLLDRHLANVSGRNFKPFEGQAVLPRQLEIHLSNDTGVACNLKCLNCQGQRLDTQLAPMNGKLSSLIETLGEEMPLYVLSGINSEPTLNPGLIDLIELIKRSGSNFGLHTNAVLLPRLEEKYNFVSRLVDVSDMNDYVSISIDSGSPESFATSKGVSSAFYFLAMKGINMLSWAKEETHKTSPNIRLTYLLNRYNSSSSEIESIIRTATMLNLDSLRFSMPYAPFGLTMDECREHWSVFEFALFTRIWDSLFPFLSKDESEKPTVFVIPPEKQDLSLFSFRHCFYGYQMITLGSDGFFYRCSAVAHPFFKHLRLGPLTDNISDFLKMILKNQDPEFDPQVSCFPHGARCNRGAIEINRVFERRHDTLIV